MNKLRLLLAFLLIAISGFITPAQSYAAATKDDRTYDQNIQVNYAALQKAGQNLNKIKNDVPALTVSASSLEYKSWEKKVLSAYRAMAIPVSALAKLRASPGFKSSDAKLKTSMDAWMKLITYAKREGNTFDPSKKAAGKKLQEVASTTLEEWYRAYVADFAALNR